MDKIHKSEIQPNNDQKFSVSVVLIFISVCTAVGAWTWLWDPDTSQVTLNKTCCVALDKAFFFFFFFFFKLLRCFLMSTHGICLHGEIRIFFLSDTSS